MMEFLDTLFLFLMFLIYIPVAFISLSFIIAILGEWRRPR